MERTAANGPDKPKGSVMGGCIMGKCFICGGTVDEDEWDVIFDDADFNVLVHSGCFEAIPERIEGMQAKIELLKTLKALRDAQE